MSKITNDGLTRRLNPVWHVMLYSCTHIATVGVKELTVIIKAYSCLYKNSKLSIDITVTKTLCCVDIAAQKQRRRDKNNTDSY